jgi:hypothetical protein
MKNTKPGPNSSSSNQEWGYIGKNKNLQIMSENYDYAILRIEKH